jgi:elongation factor Ts
LGENIQIRRVAILQADAEGIIGSYVHSARIGVVVAVSPANVELAKDLAMHVAASNPIVVNPDDVPADLITQEKEIFKAQCAESGKPAEIIEKMIAGRIHKFLSEVSLMGQPFVKDPAVTVANLLSKAKVQVKGFVRFEVGEGIEKPVEDFAKAVMDQIGGGT